MATVKQLYDLLDRKAPFRTQMDFDNAGFLVGRGDRTVIRVLVALDITPEVIAEAAEKGCQLILAHHPVIWGKLGQVTDESATGRKVLALIEKGIAAICAHTNLDAAEGGVNTALAQRLGLENPVPLETDGVDEAGRPYGIGRVSTVAGAPKYAPEFAAVVKEARGANGVRYVDARRPVRRPLQLPLQCDPAEHPGGHVLWRDAHHNRAVGKGLRAVMPAHAVHGGAAFLGRRTDDLSARAHAEGIHPLARHLRL